MKKSKKQNYDYLAFISYQRKDEAIAKRLQHTLEFYNLPIAVIEKHPGLKEGIRPIFVDMTELGDEPFLKPAIEKALKESRFLIVICSPKSAKSKWVNKEVQYFLQLKRTKRIIPFIIEGTPNAQVEDEECCTPLLKKLLCERELLGLNINEMGFDAAAVKVVSRMFHVGFRTLWNRYEKEKEEEQRKLKEQKDRLLIAQSRFVAEKAEKLTDDGDSYLARRLAIEIMPENVENPERPIAVEAEKLLRLSWEKECAILKGHTHSASAIVSIFNKDGSKIFSIGYDGHLCVWNVSNGFLLYRNQLCDGYGTALCLSPDGNTIVAAVGNKVFMLDVSTYELRCKPLSHSTYVSQVAYSVDGEYIFTALPNGRIKIWGKNGAYVNEFQDNENNDFRSVDWMSINKNNRLFTSTRESLNLWDFNKGEVSNAGGIPLPIGRSNSMKFSPDGNFMVTSKESELFIWDTHSYSTKTRSYSLVSEKPLPHHGEILAIDISPDSRQIAVGADNQLYIWTCDFRYNYYLSEWKNTELLEFDNRIDHICYQKEKNVLIVSFNNSDVRIIDFTTKEPRKLPISADSISFSPDGKLFAIVNDKEYAPIVYGLDNYQIRLRVQDTHEAVFRTRDSKNMIVVFHENGGMLLTISDYIDKWNVKNISYIKTPHNRFGRYDCCCRVISRNGKRAVFSFQRGETLLINVDDGSVVKRLTIDTSRTNYPYPMISFSYDSKYIATTSKNGDAKIWDARTGDMLCNLPPAPTIYWGNSIEFSKDGTFIISANQNHNAVIWRWDPETNHALFFSILEGHDEIVTHASFSNDGRLAVTASPNKIIVWEVRSSTIMKEIIHPYEKKFVCFSPDNSRFFSSDGESLFVWDFPTLQDLINETRERFGGRELTPEERKQYYLE